MNASSVQLSIIIKTLNEERNIGRCIEAALAATRSLSTEIIVADSGSSDRTIDIAGKFPVIIAQLTNFSERCCGIGAQLGYQHSHGDFVLILDADMVLHQKFIYTAIEWMKTEAKCAGVGGQLVEKSGQGYEYELRSTMPIEANVNVSWLDGVGLYRRAAIEDVGYFSNRNLHAYEEKELGLRLSTNGWQIFRLGIVAVDHYGHTLNSVGLLWRRWKSGYADACGESLRASIGKPYFWKMLAVHKTLTIFSLGQILFAASLLLMPWTFWPIHLCISLIAIITCIQVVRKSSMKQAMYSLLYTNVFAMGLIRGLLKSQIDPKQRIESELK